MKLTNVIRDSFIRAAMQDVPSKADNTEKIRSLVLSDMVNRLPEDVKKVWNNLATRHYLKTDYNTYGGVSVNYPAEQQSNSWNKPALSSVVKDLVDALALENQQNVEALEKLRIKLKAAAYGCTTRKQLVELLPEFEKYLPADEAKAIKSNLPSVANLVSEFSKAGWPKSNATSA